MLQAKYRSCAELDHFVVQIHGKLLYEKTIQLVFDYACSVWCRTKQGNISKLQRTQTTLLELLMTTSITLISEVFSYYMNSTGHQLKKDAITLQQ